MTRFFSDLASLDRFTRELDFYADQLICPHCRQHHQFVSHGYIYQKQHQGEPIPVGRRIICSGRYGRGGCGRTVQLYLSHRIPQWHYGTETLTRFLLALFSGQAILHAYQSATACLDPRHVYRWLNKLLQKLPDYRERLMKPVASTTDEIPATKNHRLKCLLPALRFFSGAFS